MSTQISFGLFLSLTCIAASGQTPPVPRPTTDHPSNGVVEMIVKADLTEREHEMRNEGASLLAPWRGILQVTIRNLSAETLKLMELSWDQEYEFEVLDSSGKSVPPTKEGEKSFIMAHDPLQVPLGGPIGYLELGGMQDFSGTINLAQLFQIRPGQAYKVRIRRSKGLPKVDEHGKPLKDPELRCTVDIPDYGIPR
jgi:hypothetical protein